MLLIFAKNWKTYYHMIGNRVEVLIDKVRISLCQSGLMENTSVKPKQMTNASVLVFLFSCEKDLTKQLG